MTRRAQFAVGLVAISCVAFGLGLALPLFSVTPAAGQWTSVARIFAADEFQTRTFTLPGGIALLWTEHERGLAVLLGSLALVLPVAKLCVLWWEAFAAGSFAPRVMTFFRVVSHYAMVEVFLVALTVLLVKGLPGGSYVVLHAGTYAFTASVLLSLAASRLVTE
ncbi:MAG: paraquat-inducible protein A [Akkermansiaceae bacterium]|nr:paraquat-inducible protein A [Akkermansiaceae bacterium]